MDIVVLIIMFAFMVLFTFLGLKFVEFSAISMFFTLFIIGYLLNDGLTATIGYASGSAVSATYGVEGVILIPLLLFIFNVYCILVYNKGKRG